MSRVRQTHSTNKKQITKLKKDNSISCPFNFPLKHYKC